MPKRNPTLRKKKPMTVKVTLEASAANAPVTYASPDSFGANSDVSNCDRPFSNGTKFIVANPIETNSIGANSISIGAEFSEVDHSIGAGFMGSNSIGSNLKNSEESRDENSKVANSINANSFGSNAIVRNSIGARSTGPNSFGDLNGQNSETARVPKAGSNPGNLEVEGRIPKHRKSKSSLTDASGISMSYSKRRQ